MSPTIVQTYSPGGPDAEVKETLKARYQAADRYLVYKRVVWLKYEDMAANRLTDSVSANTKSQVFDPILSTLALDRSGRVMAQIQAGKVKAIDRSDEAGEQLMNLSLDRYVVPNANAQFDYLTKCRLVDYYSSIYGNYFSFVDWDVKQNGYIGPDFWLIPIRDVFPQVGAISLEDSDYVLIRYWLPLSYFEKLAGKDGVKNLDKVLTKLKESQASGDKQTRPAQYLTSRELQNQNNAAQPSKGDGFFEVVGMYERDKWTYWCKDADEVFKELDNPHQNGELPVISKYSIPMLDDFFGQGDFERGSSMQFTANSLWNLYLDGVKISIFPPVMINKEAIADFSSIKSGPAAKWLMKGAIGNAAQVMNLNPQGAATFSNAMQFVKGSLLNQFGTTDTTITDKIEPGFGKTPQALQMQAQRENARDNIDRFYMEQFLVKLNNRFVNLLAKMGDQIQFSMFKDEIAELSLRYPEISDMYDEKTGKLTVSAKKYRGIQYQYEIISGSTYQTDQQQQQQNLQQLFNQCIQGLQVVNGEITSPLLMLLKQEGKEIQVGELFTRLVSQSGITDWDKIIKDQNSNSQAVLNDHAQQLQQIVSALTNGAVGPNGIPAQPGATPRGPRETINYKDAPPQAQAMMLQQAGLINNQSPARSPIPPQMMGGVNG